MASGARRWRRSGRQLLGPTLLTTVVATTLIILASTNDSGVKGNGNSSAPGLSAGGTKVAFSSNATNLDPANTSVVLDVYVKDLRTGNITLASTNDSGVKGNGSSGNPSLSGNGTTVAFTSDASNLTPATRMGATTSM
jgi:Tol biopolymer transport system component